jgi:hypothetical protein
VTSVWVLAALAAPLCAQAAQNAGAKPPSKEWLAWKLGREYAFAAAWGLMKKAPDSEKSLGFARTAAKALGVAEPAPPGTDYMKNVVALAKDLQARHGEPVRNHFLVGVRLTDAWFGTAIGADVTTQVTDLSSFLAKSGIPRTVWNAQLTAIKAKATEADLRKLAQSIDAHLRR